MKAAYITKPFAFLSFSFLLFGFSDSKSSSSTHPSADLVLTEAQKALASIKTLQYDYLLETNYISENYSNSFAGTAYIDFSSNDTIIGFTFQLEDEKSKVVYNGIEHFLLEKGPKAMQLTTMPNLQTFTGTTAFYNSLVTLRKALSEIIADKAIERSIADTSLMNKEYYLVNLALDKRTINRFGGFSTLSTDRKITYKIVIDKSSYLPVQLIQGNNVNKDFTRSTFSNILTSPAKPIELSWYYSSYTDEYKIARPKSIKPLALGSTAPDWQLPLFGGNDELKLSQMAGKVVLLEFWNKNCGYCILAVPKLNAVAEKYKNRNFVVLGINTYDKKEDIENFYRRTVPNYQTVINGGKVAEMYGIEGNPQVALLDKQGKVLYLGKVDEAAIERLVQGALKN